MNIEFDRYLQPTAYFIFKRNQQAILREKKRGYKNRHSKVTFSFTAECDLQNIFLIYIDLSSTVNISKCKMLTYTDTSVYI